MSFGSRRLDDAFDRWVTQTPEEAGYYEEDDEEEETNVSEEVKKKWTEQEK